MSSTTSERIGTFSAFESPSFRLYFLGQLVSVSGTWMQNLAQGYLVFQLTKSEAWLGIVACASGLSVILLSPISGVIVDRIPRKRLMMITQFIQMCLALVLFALAYTETIQVWHIVMMAFLLGSTNAIDFPARQTFVLEVVGSHHLKSGIALTAIVNSSSRVLGPSIAGIALLTVGAAWCFFLNALSFMGSLVALYLITVPYPITTSRTENPLKQLREGLSYARHSKLIAPLLMTSLAGGVFVVPLLQLLPAFADLVLNSPREGYALLSASQGFGSVIAGLLLGMVTTRFGYTVTMNWAIVGSGLSTILLAVQIATIPAMIACFFSGLFMILQFVSINTQIQTVVPNEFRGRILSLYTLSFTGFTPFGALLLGIVAQFIGTPAALALYGVLGIVICFSILEYYKRHA